MLLTLLVLGVVIGSNNFATALSLGALGQADRRARILLVFGVFEFTVPLVGLWLGSRVSGLVSEQVGWLGPLLIAALGLFTLFEATRKSHDQARLARWLASWRGLILLAAGLSVDNLVLGFSLGLRNLPALLTATVIMACSVTFTWVGLRIGRQGRRSFETVAEVASALLLLGIAWLDWIGRL